MSQIEGSCSMVDKAVMVVLALVLSGSILTAGGAETWSGVALVDAMCSLKVKAKPDQHTRECALQCAKSGFGVFTADGEYLKFDAKGNERAVALLKGSKEPDGLRVNVTGTKNGDTITVATLQLAP